MPTTSIPIAINLRQDLTEITRNELLGQLKSEPSVGRAGFSHQVRQFLLVEYDAATINATQVKQHINRILIADGPATCLVGM